MKTLLTSMLVFISTLVFSQTLPQKIDEDNQIREYNGYIISYNETCEQANWVYYVIKPSDLIGDRTRRRNNFRVDDSIKTVTAELKDYRGSGYDRGHLKPSGDEPTDSTQMSETFYMSNISPQEPSFNRGIWKKLENRVRAIVMESDSVVVITGGVLKEGLKTIGDNKVCVPNHYFKVLYIYKADNLEILCFLIPNKKSDESIYTYIVDLSTLQDFVSIEF
jgi:endonuclease G